MFMRMYACMHVCMLELAHCALAVGTQRNVGKVCLCIYVCIYVHVSKCVCMHVARVYVHVSKCVCMYVGRVYVHVSKCVCMYACG